MTHRLASITEAPAKEQGSIDGWKATCSCGHSAAFSIRSMTVEWGHDHAAYMNAKEAKAAG